MSRPVAKPYPKEFRGDVVRVTRNREPSAAHGPVPAGKLPPWDYLTAGALVPWDCPDSLGLPDYDDTLKAMTETTSARIRSRP